MNLVSGAILATSAGGPVGDTQIAYPDGLSTYSLSALQVSAAAVGAGLSARLAVTGNPVPVTATVSGTVSGVLTQDVAGAARVIARFSTAAFSVTQASGAQPLALLLDGVLPASVAGLVLTCWIGPATAIAEIPDDANVLAVQGLPNLLKWATNPVAAAAGGPQAATPPSILQLSSEEVLVGSLGLGVVAASAGLAVMRARSRARERG